MIWAALALGIVSVIGMVVCTVLVASTFRKALQDAANSNATMQVAYSAQIREILDRLMTIKWEDFAALRSTLEVEEEGGFIPPEEEGGVEVKSWAGTPIALSDLPRPDADLNELLDEDFDETGEVRR